MIDLSLAEVVQAVGGRLADGAAPDSRVTADVVVDSRAVRHGGLFVALPGERADGHDFARAAADAGAAAVLATRAVGVPAVLVDDGVRALGALAHAVLGRLPDATVVGITGSSGKTSTKDLTAHVLARLGPTVAPPGSYNNEIGHPLTVLRADRATRQLVLECSARGVGHIAMLCRIAPPRIGVVLNVGSAHLGEFGSREAVAQAKGELVEALPADGVAVLNADDPLVAAMASRTKARTVHVGRSGSADVRAADVTLDDGGRASFTVDARGERAAVRLGLVGAHHVGNALAAAAVALELGLPLPEVVDALGSARPASRWRMEVSDRADGVTVVNDAYNANPESMRAALDALVAMARGRRTWAVLGAMGELGDASAAAHAELGAAVAERGVDRLVVVGTPARPVADAAASQGLRPDVVADVGAAVALLQADLRERDVVLVKASRSEGLERVAAALLDEDGRPAEPPGPQAGRA